MSTVEHEFPHDVLTDPERLAAVARSGLLDSAEEEAYDRLTRLASQMLGTPAAVMSVLTADRQFIKSQIGMSGPAATDRETPMSRSFCQYVVRSGSPLSVPDARADPRLHDNPAIEDGTIGYLGVPLRDPDGHVLGAFCAVTPEPRSWTQAELETLNELASLVLTELRLSRTVAVLDQTARALEEAQVVAQVGSWEWDPVADAFHWSRELCRILGVARGPRNRAEYEAFVDPEYRRDLEQRLMTALSTGGRWESEYPMRRPDGSTRMFVSRGQVVTAADGTIAGARGTVQDVTFRHEQEQRFRAAFAQAPVGVAMVGLRGEERGVCLEANAVLERMLGTEPRGLTGVTMTSLLDPTEAAASRDRLARLASGDTDHSEVETCLRHRDGTLVWAWCTGSVVRDPGGAPVYTIAHIVDISDRKRHQAELEYMAHHDPLTGLWNRRRFAEELERTLAHATRYGREGALLSFDLDHFKAVNDQAGHGAGDRVLVAISEALRSELRESDVFARMGGDEFSILLPEASAYQATCVAEKVLRTVHAHGGVPDADLGVTASIGIGCWTAEDPLDFAQAVQRADIAMYDAKSAGGNDYAVYGATGSPRRLPSS